MKGAIMVASLELSPKHHGESQGKVLGMLRELQREKLNAKVYCHDLDQASHGIDDEEKGAVTETCGVILKDMFKDPHVNKYSPMIEDGIVGVLGNLETPEAQRILIGVLWKPLGDFNQDFWPDWNRDIRLRLGHRARVALAQSKILSPGAIHDLLTSQDPDVFEFGIGLVEKEEKGGQRGLTKPFGLNGEGRVEREVEQAIQTMLGQPDRQRKAVSLAILFSKRSNGQISQEVVLTVTEFLIKGLTRQTEELYDNQRLQDYVNKIVEGNRNRLDQTVNLEDLDAYMDKFLVQLPLNQDFEDLLALTGSMEKMLEIPGARKYAAVIGLAIRAVKQALTPIAQEMIKEWPTVRVARERTEEIKRQEVQRIAKEKEDAEKLKLEDIQRKKKAFEEEPKKREEERLAQMRHNQEVMLGVGVNDQDLTSLLGQLGIKEPEEKPALEAVALSPKKIGWGKRIGIIFKRK